MVRKSAIMLAIAMLAIFAWGLYFEAGSTNIVINGQELIGPLKGAIGVAGFVVGLVSLFCAAILLLFVFAGIGIFIIGGVIVAGLVLAGFAFPVLLFLLLPLAVVWLFIALVRGTGT
ncbi:MAG: hypothetical protein WCA64_00580 [Gallionella sp.]